ncbi:outer membrane lipoprotein carrier protein LolA [Amylibacter sp.]|nr:outer membrane lipoprotein carrier protein LolA [Amylibacter sp.]
MKIVETVIKMMLKIKILFKILFITSFMTHPSFAEKISLDNISEYINGLKMVEADFEQVNSDGSIDTGKLYIRRPGKMRLEYEAPNNALVIAGAGSVAIFDDKAKNGPTIFPLKKTPLNLLLKKDVNLIENKMISEHKEKNKNTFIVVQDPERLSQGKIEMVFSNQPILLESWTITNQSNQKTKIMLNNLHEVAKIPLYLFNITAANKIKN